MGCCSSCCKSSPVNDFSEGVMNLNTRHRDFMRKRRNYTISVDRQQLIGGHHIIVISDGKNEDITFELTFKGSKLSATAGQEEAIAKVAIYDGANRNYLERKGEVYRTLYELAETAASIFTDNPHYNLLNNNCQNFCNKFLAAYNLPTYATDTEIVQTAGKFISTVSTLLSGSSQQN